MKTWKFALLITVMALGLGIDARAQVDKVAMRTTGISCGSCATLSDTMLRKVPSVSDVKVVLEKEMIMLSLKPTMAFQPWDLRDVLERADVGVVQIQISARGNVVEENGKKYLVAGKDKFVILPTSTAKVNAGDKGTFQGTVNDHPDPMELKVLSFATEAQ